MISGRSKYWAKIGARLNALLMLLLIKPCVGRVSVAVVAFLQRGQFVHGLAQLGDLLLVEHLGKIGVPIFLHRLHVAFEIGPRHQRQRRCHGASPRD